MIDKILRVPDVCEAIGVRKSSLYAMVKEGKFPPPLKLTSQCVGWKTSTVQAWIDGRQIASAYAEADC